MTLKYFTIYGERCSGTNFLMQSIRENFNIEYTTKYCWKHFFGHYQFENNEEENDTLFIGIIREPISWIDSFFKKKHHLPDENRSNIHSFLFNQFYSIYEDTYTEIKEDRNMITNERYKNIFELRKIKNNFLINEMKNRVKNYVLIRYEDLRDNYDVILNFLKNKFNLNKIGNGDKYIEILNYKGIPNKLYIPKNISINKNIIKIILKNIDKSQEKSLGYLI